MTWLILLLLVIAGVNIVDAYWGRGRRRGAALRHGARYEASPLLVNASERAAWHLLHELPLGAHAVCPKVRLEDVLEAQGPHRQHLRGHVKSRHVDFLLVDEGWRPRLVVEVDGASHLREDRIARDRLVDGALASAGIPIVRLRVGEDWRAALRPWIQERLAHAASRG